MRPSASGVPCVCPISTSATTIPPAPVSFICVASPAGGAPSPIMFRQFGARRLRFDDLEIRQVPSRRRAPVRHRPDSSRARRRPSAHPSAGCGSCRSCSPLRSRSSPSSCAVKPGKQRARARIAAPATPSADRPRRPQATTHNSVTPPRIASVRPRRLAIIASPPCHAPRARLRRRLRSTASPIAAADTSTGTSAMLRKRERGPEIFDVLAQIGLNPAQALARL